VFLIRARQGFTGRLRKLAAAGQATVPAYIDGPYGCPPDLKRFSTCVLFAGGSGVSYTISLLMSIIQCVSNKQSVDNLLTVFVVRLTHRLRSFAESCLCGRFGIPVSH
jgi:ferric-chelate reductase